MKLHILTSAQICTERILEQCWPPNSIRYRGFTRNGSLRATLPNGMGIFVRKDGSVRQNGVWLIT